MKLHHVGYTVADIHVSAKRFALLGYQAGEVLYEESLSVELCYLTKEGSAVIELVHQLQADSLEAQLLRAGGVMPYHLGYEAEAFDEACEKLEAQGYREIRSSGIQPVVQSRSCRGLGRETHLLLPPSGHRLR